MIDSVPAERTTIRERIRNPAPVAWQGIGLRITLTLSFIVVAAATIVIYGWGVNSETLVQFYPTWPSMSPWTAFGLVGTGLSIILQTRTSRWEILAGRVLACTGIFLSSLAIIEHAFNFTTPLSSFAWGDTELWHTSVDPGRIPFPVAVTIFFLSVASLLLRSSGTKAFNVSMVAQALAYIFPGVAVLGYMYDAVPVLVLWGEDGGMALLATMSCLMLSVALAAAHPDRPPAAWLMKSDDRVTVLRVLLTILFLPLIFRLTDTLAKAFGIQHNSEDTTVALIITAIITTIGILLIGGRERRTTQQLREDAERLLVTFDEAPVGMAIVSKEGKLLEVNDMFKYLAGLSEEDILGQRMSSFITAEMEELFVEGLEEILQGKQRRVRLDVKLRQPKRAEPLWVEIYLTSVNKGDGSGIRYLILQMLDLNDRKRLERHLTHKATHDPLTGLANRAGYEIYVEKLVEDPHLVNKDFSLIYFDLDKFKKVNDTYGHRMGDEVLCAVAARMTAAVRPGDFVSRIGGDEFVVVTQCTSEQASVVMKRLRAAVEGDFEALGNTVGIRISMGSSNFDRDNPMEMLNTADMNMYDEKRYRENTVSEGSVK